MQVSTDKQGRPVIFIETAAEYARARREVLAAERLGVDTESNSMHAFRERTCTIQVSAPTGHFIFDPILMGCPADLGGVFADPGVEKIFHGGVYDLALLKRDFDFEFAGLFDTAISADLLGYPRIGLSSLVERFCGVVLEKRYTTSDWARRPLDPGQMEYLYLDTLYLFDLADRLRDRLRAADLLEEATLEFAALTKTTPLKNAHEGKDSLSLKGYDRLESGRERAVLAEVFAWRQVVAEKLDRPPFKVLGNPVLFELARRRPLDRAGCLAIKGFTPRVWKKFGSDILAAVARGRSHPPEDFPPRPRVRRRRDADAGDLAQELKRWRTAAAERDGVGRLAILPGRLLEELVRVRPSAPAELAELVGEGRTRKYGREILRILT